MTAPERPEHGADDQWAAELHAIALDLEAVRRAAFAPTPQVFDRTDMCKCQHPHGHHYKAEPDWPMRCAHGSCGCIGFRYLSPNEDDHEVRMDRMRDCSDPEED